MDSHHPSPSLCGGRRAGEVVPITHGAASHLLRVTALQTQTGGKRAGCLVDTAITAEFEACPDAPVEEDIQLFFKNSINAIIEKDDYFYCRLKLPEQFENANFVLTSHEGHGDLYIHSELGKPTRQQHQWYAIDAEDKMELLIPGKELEGIRWLYIGVHAYSDKTRFHLTVVDKKEEEEVKGSKVGAGDEAWKATDPNHELCPTCGRYISKMAMMMHSAHCARRNWFCKICKLAIPSKEKDRHIHCDACALVFSSPEALKKHRELKHDLQPCPLCKEMVMADALAYHMAEECHERLVECSWCGMKLSAGALADHEVYCASQSVECHLCSALVPRNRFEIHLSTVHLINPSLASGQKVIETQRIMDRLPIDATEKDLTEALEESKLTSSGDEEELKKLADKMTLKQCRNVEKFDFTGSDLSGMALTESEAVHDFPCPYCDKNVPLTEDFAEHMISCEEKMQENSV